MDIRRKLTSIAAVLPVIVTGSADAQTNEQDRLNRCQNNRDALARLEARRSLYATDEHIARAYTALSAIKDIELEITVNNMDAQDNLKDLNKLQALAPSPQRDAAIANAHARNREFTRRNADAGEQIRSAAAPFGLTCAANDYACSRQLYERLENAYNATVQHRGQLPEFLRQVEVHRNNLIALRCDQAGDSTGAVALADPYGTRWSERESGWAGDWVRRGKSNVYDASWNGGVVKAVLTISINGNSVQVSRQNATDSNNCQYQGTLSGNRVTGKYSCTSGGGEWSATIQ